MVRSVVGTCLLSVAGLAACGGPGTVPAPPGAQVSESLPEVTVADLAAAVAWRSADQVLARLAVLGCPLALPDEGWLPLVGAREYVTLPACAVTLGGVPGRLVVEAQRGTEPGSAPVIELLRVEPPPDAVGWLDQVSAALGVVPGQAVPGQPGAVLLARPPQLSLAAPHRVRARSQGEEVED